MKLVCLSCRTEWDGEQNSECPGCGDTDSLTEEQEGNRHILLKVSSSLYSEYCDVCRSNNLQPEPGVMFESDDDLQMNIDVLKERLLEKRP